MSSEDMFANSEEVDNPDPFGNEDMEVDNNAETPVADDNNEENAGQSEEPHDEETTEFNNSGDNILSDKTNVSQSEEAEDTPTKDKEDSVKLFRFPQGRIKSIMKMDPDVGMVNSEAIFLVNKAVEEFIQCLAVESYHYTASSKKKTIMKDHVMTAIESVDELAFLDGAMED